MIQVLSWGLGTQSTYLGEASAQGLLPRLDYVIHADTGWEREQSRYIRDFYTARWRGMGMHVIILEGPSIRDFATKNHVHIPFWTSSGGPLRRECTRYIKVRPIRRKLRQLYIWRHGIRGREQRYVRMPPGAFEQWLGFSYDEWHRMKNSPVKYTQNRYPMVENKTTRNEAVDWLRQQGLPAPIKSACVCCPYRSASGWLDMRENWPSEWTEAVKFDEHIRHVKIGSIESDELFVYQHTVPLRDADLETDVLRERQGTQLPLMICNEGDCWT